MRQSNVESARPGSKFRVTVSALVVGTALLTGCRAATTSSALNPAPTPSPTAMAASPVTAEVTPTPTAAPTGDAVNTPRGWARYTNLNHGFSFAYPASWSLVETPATESEPAAVWLRWELFRLLIQYKDAADPAPLQGYGSARNWREAGTVAALGHEATREVLRVEGRVKRVTYRVERRPLAAGGLVFGINLRSAAADECLGTFDLDCDYADVDLPESLQAEADRIVESLELVAPALIADDSQVGWATYTRPGYGFSLRYPPAWVLSEGRSFVAFTQGTIRLVLGYGGAAEEINVCCTLGPELARVRDAGTVDALGSELRRGVLEEEGVVTAVVYNGVERVHVDGRAFVAYLQDFSASQDTAGIPPRLQADADAILESVVLFEPASPLPASSVVPTAEPPAPTPEVVAPPDAAVTGRGTGGNVRSGPGTRHEVVGFLDVGDKAHVIGRFRDWWQIDYGGEPAWVANQVVLATNTTGVPDVEPSGAPRSTPPPEAGPVLVVAATKLNVRTGPGTSYLRVGSLDPGAQVMVLGSRGDWWQIDYRGEPAWVSGEFASAYNAEAVPEVEAPAVALAPNPDFIPPPARPSEIEEERWIDLDLSDQRVTVYERGSPVYQTLVSTGLPNTPTPTGQFRIWIKLRYDDMSGPDYYLENVPYVMYFYQGYGFHGVWWHGNFGSPMSHGCVNLPNGADEWLFNWADVGTLVNVHE